MKTIERDFSNISPDETAEKLEAYLTHVDELDCVYERWLWDGIIGSSLIFYAEDFKGKNEDEVKSWLVEKYELLKNKDLDLITVVRNHVVFPYLIMNFDFNVE